MVDPQGCESAQFMLAGRIHMSRILKQTEVLEFYEVAELFLASDQTGDRFICLLVEMLPATNRYLCVQVSDRRYFALLRGELDLREAMQTPETGDHYLGDSADDDVFSVEQTDEVPERWLPKPGYFLKYARPEVESRLI